MNPINITDGSAPSVDQQVTNQRLRGVFVNNKSELQLLPNFDLIQSIDNAVSILKSTFNDRYIIATTTNIFYFLDDTLEQVGIINASSFPVRMAENEQGQVCIVNGAGAWVFDQPNNNFFQLDSNTNGFDIENPTDVTSLNTFLIVVGGSDQRWIVSNANDATQWAANEVVVEDSKTGNLTGVKSLNNNLFIFGEGAVQRWIPSTERLPSDFPFSQDPTYQDEYGCISTGSLVSQNNLIFYLSANGQVRMMTDSGKKIVTNDGIESILDKYDDKEFSYGSMYFFKGNWLYHLNFENENNSFVYCPMSNRWSEIDQKLRSFDELAIFSDGLYQLNNDYSVNAREIVIQTPYEIIKQNNPYQRSVLSSVYLSLTQGKLFDSDFNQYCFLQLSKDNITYGNRVRRLLSPVGKTRNQLRWYMNYVSDGFSLRFTLLVKNDITIESGWYNLT